MSGASTGLVPVTPASLVIHECRGLKKGSNESGERKLCLERLPEDDPSGMAYEVRVEHPEFVTTSLGVRTRQYPEIVARTNNEAHAKLAFHTYAKILGGAAPDSFAPAPASAGGDFAESGRVRDLELELGKVLARLEALEKP